MFALLSLMTLAIASASPNLTPSWNASLHQNLETHVRVPRDCRECIPWDTSYCTRGQSIYEESPLFGGGGGTAFDQRSSMMPADTLRRVEIRSGRRLDQVSFVMSSGNVYRKGGNGGSSKYMRLRGSQRITAVEVCKKKSKRRGRKKDTIFFIRFERNDGAFLEGGRRTNGCETFRSYDPLVGMYGRSGREIDSIGFIYRIKDICDG